jgi:pre-mRNA-splicing factor SYF2
MRICNFQGSPSLAATSFSTHLQLSCFSLSFVSAVFYLPNMNSEEDVSTSAESQPRPMRYGEPELVAEDTAAPTDAPVANEKPAEDKSTKADDSPQTDEDQAQEESKPAKDAAATEQSPADAAKAAHEARLANWNRVKALAAQARRDNLKAAQEEAKREASDPNLISKLERKRLQAQDKLIKEETKDYERKRAWDWTAEESDKWDRHLAKKQKNRENVAFANYGEEASRDYKRGIKDLPQVDQEEIVKRRQEEIERGVRRGDLELVEDEDGNVQVVDKKGTFYSKPEQYQFDHKPSEEAIDRLVAAMEKKEAKRLKNRRDRNRQEEQGDVTYINDKVRPFP